jgi:putative PIN family toxin of toxin-antitoxin system
VIRAVVDTNVLVSGLLSPAGNEALILLAVNQGLIRPCVSAEVLAEYAAVLARPKFSFPPDEIMAVIAMFREKGELVAPEGAAPRLPIPTTPSFCIAPQQRKPNTSLPAISGIFRKKLAGPYASPTRASSSTASCSKSDRHAAWQCARRGSARHESAGREAARASSGRTAGQFLGRLDIGTSQHRLRGVTVEPGAGKGGQLARDCGLAPAIGAEPAPPGKRAGGGEIGFAMLGIERRDGLARDRRRYPLCQQAGANLVPRLTAPVQRLHPRHGIGHIIDQPRRTIAFDQRLDRSGKFRDRLGRPPTDASQQHPPQILRRAGIMPEIAEGPSLDQLWRNLSPRSGTAHRLRPKK